MSQPVKPLNFKPRARRPKKTTRFQPILGRDGHVLVSAARMKEMDVEALCERLSEPFLRCLRRASDDELSVLEAFAEGLYHLRLRRDEFVVNGKVIAGAYDGFDRVAGAVPRVLPIVQPDAKPKET